MPARSICCSSACWRRASWSCCCCSSLLLRFAIHYRAGNADADRDHRIKKSWHWEVSWTAATLVAFLGLFVWGAQLYLDLQDAPKDALPVYVVGQAMDVEGPASRRPARDQRAAHAARARGAADHGVAGRHPLVLHPGVPHQARRGAGHVPRRSGSGRASPACFICSAPNIAAPIIRA